MIIIGVATDQNSTNLIPAVYYQGRKDAHTFICLATPRMEEKAKALLDVLYKNYSYKTDVINIVEGSSTIGILQKIQELNVDWKYETVIWNLGGGQKKHTLALLEAFRTRSSMNISDLACYVDPETHKIAEFRYESEHLIEVSEPLVGYLSVEIDTEHLIKMYITEGNITTKRVDFRESDQFKQMIREGYDFTKQEKRKELFASHRKIQQRKIFEAEGKFSIDYINQIGWESAVRADLRTAISKLFDNKNFDPSAYINLFLGKVDNNNNGNNKDGFLVKKLKDNTVTDDLNPKFSDYFEDLVVQKINKFLEANASKNNIAHKHKKYEVLKDNNKLIEFDILLQTKQGQLIYFEAKTFSWSLKEFNAKLQNNRKVGGVYVDMIVVIPYFTADLNQDIMTNALQKMPLYLKAMEAKFCVICEDALDYFYVCSNDDNKTQSICYTEKEAREFKDYVKCTQLEFYLTHTDLLSK